MDCSVDSLRLAGFVGEPAELDAAIAEIREIERRGGIDRTLAIGRFVLHRFFGGSVEAWRERSRHKNNSVRRLAQHPRCPLSRSALNQAIGIYVAFQTLTCDQTFGHIGPSHISLVLHLAPPAQRDWLERAERQGWSVRELKARVTEERRRTGERRGRPRMAQGAQAISSAKKLVRSLERVLAELRKTGLQPPDGSEIATVADRLGRLEADLRGMLRRPHQAIPDGRAKTKPESCVTSELKDTG